MNDLLYLTVILIFFALSIGLIAGCAALRKG